MYVVRECIYSVLQGICAILILRLILVHVSLHISVSIHSYKKRAAHNFALAIMANSV